MDPLLAFCYREWSVHLELIGLLAVQQWRGLYARRVLSFLDLRAKVNFSHPPRKESETDDAAGKKTVFQVQ